MTAKEVIQNAGGEVRAPDGWVFRSDGHALSLCLADYIGTVLDGQSCLLDALLAEHERQLLAQFEEVECGECLGRGDYFEPLINKRMPCQTCNGTGKLFRKREAQS